MGTPGYICPTYCKKAIYDAKADIYSFGVVVAEVLSGKLQGTFGAGDEFFEDDFEAIVADARPVRGCEGAVAARLLDLAKVR